MPCGTHSVFTRATETAACPCLSAPSEPQSGCLPSCRERRIAPPCRLRCVLWLEDASQPFAPFSPRSRRCVRQHVMRSAPRPASLRRFALRLLECCERAMPRTDFCHLTSSYPYPRLAGSRCVGRFRGARILGCLPDARQCKLASAGRTGSRWNRHRGGRSLPAVMRAYRASDTPVASPDLPRPFARSRTTSRAAKTASCRLA